MGEELVAAFMAPYAPRTRDNYRQYLLRWLDWCATAGVHVLDAERFHAEARIRHMREVTGLAPRTIRTHVSAWASFYDWAVTERLIPHSPLAHLRRPRAPSLTTREFLTREEVRALLAAATAADPNTDALVHLLALNGPRIGELVDASIAHLGRYGNATTLRLVRRKGAGVDAIILAPPTERAVARAIGRRTRGPILRKDARRIRAPEARTMLRDLLPAAGIDKNVTPHDLRATFITLALEAHVPVRDVMASAGHTHESSTLYYDRLRSSIDRNATGRLTDWINEARHPDAWEEVKP